MTLGLNTLWLSSAFLSSKVPSSALFITNRFPKKLCIQGFLALFTQGAEWGCLLLIFQPIYFIRVTIYPAAIAHNISRGPWHRLNIDVPDFVLPGDWQRGQKDQEDRGHSHPFNRYVNPSPSHLSGRYSRCFFLRRLQDVKGTAKRTLFSVWNLDVLS